MRAGAGLCVSVDRRGRNGVLHKIRPPWLPAEGARYDCKPVLVCLLAGFREISRANLLDPSFCVPLRPSLRLRRLLGRVKPPDPAFSFFWVSISGLGDHAFGARTQSRGLRAMRAVARPVRGLSRSQRGVHPMLLLGRKSWRISR